MAEQRLEVGADEAGTAGPEHVDVELGNAGHRFGDVPRRRIHERREDVILEVATDTGKFDGDVDAEAVELVGRPDAGEHQQLGGIEHAGAHDELALGDDPLDGAGPLDLDADAAATFDEQAAGRAPRADDEVRVLLGRRQVGACGTDPLAVADVELDRRHALRAGAVVVRVADNARLDGGLEHVAHERVEVVPRHDRQWSSCSPVLRCSAVEVLRAPEGGEHVGEAPAVVAEVGPRVVVMPLAPGVVHAVDRARAAEDLASGVRYAPAAEAGLLGALVAPVQLPGPELEGSRRIVDGRAGVRRSRLQQQDAHTLVGEATGDGAAGGAGSDDHHLGVGREGIDLGHRPGRYGSGRSRTMGRRTEEGRARCGHLQHRRVAASKDRAGVLVRDTIAIARAAIDKGR